MDGILILLLLFFLPEGILESRWKGKAKWPRQFSPFVLQAKKARSFACNAVRDIEDDVVFAMQS